MIIQNAPMRQKQSYQTERQLALQGGLENIIGGLGSLDETLANKQQTEREQALNAQMKAFELNKAGYDITPDQILAAQGASEPTGFAALFSESKPRPSLDFSKRTQDFQNQQLLAQQDAEQKRLDREFDKQIKLATLQGVQNGRAEDRAFRQQQLAQQKEIEQMKLNPLQDPKTKLSKLSGEVQGKIGGIASGLEAVKNMGVAIEQGFGPEYIDINTPLIGRFKTDTPFTENQRIAAETFGRIQSGGAINKDEEERFINMGPRPGDSPATARRKLAQQKALFENKLVAYGINPEDLPRLGFSNSNIQQPMFTQPQGVNPLNINATASNVELLLSPERTQQRQSRIQELKAKAGQ